MTTDRYEERHVEQTSGFWGILELMGHVRVAGWITEETRFGSALGRIDIPGPNGTMTTQWFGGGSVYRLTPTTQETATAVALASQPAPIHVWDARRLLATAPEPPERAGDDEPAYDYGPYEDDGDA